MELPGGVDPHSKCKTQLFLQTEFAMKGLNGIGEGALIGPGSTLMSFPEYRTPAVYHEARCIETFGQRSGEIPNLVKDARVSVEDALFHFSLAPLSIRRDIAMLGLIHRTVLGKGPQHFQQFFTPSSRRNTLNARHRYHLADVRDGRLTRQ